MKTTGYCYHSVNVITFGLAQSDHIKRLLLNNKTDVHLSAKETIIRILTNITKILTERKVSASVCVCVYYVLKNFIFSYHFYKIWSQSYKSNLLPPSQKRCISIKNFFRILKFWEKAMRSISFKGQSGLIFSQIWRALKKSI